MAQRSTPPARVRGHMMALNPDTKAWVLGANYAMGSGKLLAGYGQKPGRCGQGQGSVTCYEYSLSKRTYVYVDVSDKKAATDVKFYIMCVHQNF